MSVGRSGPASSCCQAGTPDMPEGPFDEEEIMSEVIEYPRRIWISAAARKPRTNASVGHSANCCRSSSRRTLASMS